MLPTDDAANDNNSRLGGGGPVLWRRRQPRAFAGTRCGGGGGDYGSSSAGFGGGHLGGGGEGGRAARCIATCGFVMAAVMRAPGAAASAAAAGAASRSSSGSLNRRLANTTTCAAQYGVFCASDKLAVAPAPWAGGADCHCGGYPIQELTFGAALSGTNGTADTAAAAAIVAGSTVVPAAAIGTFGFTFSPNVPVAGIVVNGQREYARHDNGFTTEANACNGFPGSGYTGSEAGSAAAGGGYISAMDIGVAERKVSGGVTEKIISYLHLYSNSGYDCGSNTDEVKAGGVITQLRNIKVLAVGGAVGVDIVNELTFVFMNLSQPTTEPPVTRDSSDGIGAGVIAGISMAGAVVVFLVALWVRRCFRDSFAREPTAAKIWPKIVQNKMAGGDDFTDSYGGRNGGDVTPEDDETEDDDNGFGGRTLHDDFSGADIGVDDSKEMEEDTGMAIAPSSTVGGSSGRRISSAGGVSGGGSIRSGSGGRCGRHRVSWGNLSPPRLGHGSTAAAAAEVAAAAGLSSSAAAAAAEPQLAMV